MTVYPRPQRNTLHECGERMSLPKLPFTRWTISCHEAGHATLCDHFGIRYKEIVVHDDGSGGTVQLDVPKPQEEIEIPEDILRQAKRKVGLEFAAIYEGGLAAELILANIALTGHLKVNSPDNENSRELLNDAYRSDIPLWYTQRLARHLLTSRWPDVLALARDLHANGTVVRSGAHRAA